MLSSHSSCDFLLLYFASLCLIGGSYRVETVDGDDVKLPFLHCLLNLVFSVDGIAIVFCRSRRKRRLQFAVISLFFARFQFQAVYAECKLENTSCRGASESLINLRRVYSSSFAPYAGK